MKRKFRRGKPYGIGLLVSVATFMFGADGAALQLEPGRIRPDGAAMRMSYFYPYPTTFTYVDERYAFDDDPLTAFAHMPYVMRLQVKHPPMRRVMVQPRMTFVPEMFKSAETI